MPTSPAVTGPFSPIQLGPAKPKEQQDLFTSASFLRLLATQMKNQNPLEPVKDMEFIGQMAQFSTLEQTTKVSDGVAQLTLSNQIAQRASLIGRQVTYDTASGTRATGTVEKLVIDPIEKNMRLVVSGVTIDPAMIVQVEAAP